MTFGGRWKDGPGGSFLATLEVDVPASWGTSYRRVKVSVTEQSATLLTMDERRIACFSRQDSCMHVAWGPSVNPSMTARQNGARAAMLLSVAACALLPVVRDLLWCLYEEGKTTCSWDPSIITNAEGLQGRPHPTEDDMNEFLAGAKENLPDGIPFGVRIL
jgi:hypothetical protein